MLDIITFVDLYEKCGVAESGRMPRFLENIGPTKIDLVPHAERPARYITQHIMSTT